MKKDRDRSFEVCGACDIQVETVGNLGLGRNYRLEIEVWKSLRFRL